MECKDTEFRRIIRVFEVALGCLQNSCVFLWLMINLLILLRCNRIRIGESVFFNFPQHTLSDGKISESQTTTTEWIR